MDGKVLETLIFPLSREELLFDPAIISIFDNSQNYSPEVPDDSSPYVEIFASDSDMARGLNIAVEKGTFEPLATLLYSFLPEGTPWDKDNFKKFLAPYYEKLNKLRKELSENITFEVQVIDDILGDILLGSGKLLISSKGEFIPYKYLVNFENERSVVFEKYRGLQTRNLYEAVKQVRELNLIESIIRVRSKKSYSINSTILPYFAYNLIGTMESSNSAQNF